MKAGKRRKKDRKGKDFFIRTEFKYLNYGVLEAFLCLSFPHLIFFVSLSHQSVNPSILWASEADY